MTRCPGQDSRKLTVSYHPCPTCGEMVEFFSDENRVRCQKCTQVVVKQEAPSCIQWCTAARECLGADRYDRLMAALAETDPSQAPAKEKG